MANKKSSKKDLRRIAKKRVANQQVKSALKTYVKKVRTAAGSGDEAMTTETLAQAVRALDKAVQRGIIHKNQAARRKSRIAKAANQVQAAKASKATKASAAASAAAAEPAEAVAAAPKAAKKAAAPKAAAPKAAAPKAAAPKPAAKAAPKAKK